MKTVKLYSRDKKMRTELNKLYRGINLIVEGIFELNGALILKVEGARRWKGWEMNR